MKNLNDMGIDIQVSMNNTTPEGILELEMTRQEIVEKNFFNPTVYRRKMFSVSLSYLLDVRNLKGSELSVITQVPEPMISDYIRGRYAPRGNTLFKISNYFRVNPDWMIGIPGSAMINEGIATFDFDLEKSLDTTEFALNIVKTLNRPLDDVPVYSKLLEKILLLSSIGLAKVDIYASDLLSSKSLAVEKLNLNDLKKGVKLKDAKDAYVKALDKPVDELKNEENIIELLYAKTCLIHSIQGLEGLDPEIDQILSPEGNLELLNRMAQRIIMIQGKLDFDMSLYKIGDILVSNPRHNIHQLIEHCYNFAYEDGPIKMSTYGLDQVESGLERVM